MPAPTVPGPTPTRSGPVTGVRDGDVIRYLGIPYATAARGVPPVSAVPVRGSDGRPVVLAAVHPAPACPQPSSRILDALMQGALDGMERSEDCQRLSITLPADRAPGETLPVIVWFHGGGYTTGAGDLAIHDPRALVVEQRVIVVAVTSRLGLLGFGGGAPGGQPANLGLLDQLEALRWIRDSIGAFGGDPEAVTAMGQSAGGDAILHLMISAGARGLVRRAIVQSPPVGITGGRERMFRAMGRVTRSLPADAPLDAVLRRQARAERASWASGIRAGLPWGPRYGHAPLPAEADRDAAWRAVAPEVDLLIGTTRDETAMYLPALPVIAPLLRVPVVGRALRRVLMRTVVRPTSRAVYARPVRAFAARHRAAGGRAVRYVLRAAPASSPIGAGHTADVPLILGTREAWTRMRLVPPESWPEVAARGRAVRQVWADFARTGEVAPDADARACGMRFDHG
ncbi:carboxylesterase family protein [Clavibacter nebraskensis]|uniref:Carboxylesterase, type B n=3 Tax=Clavibacter nebraskensis TaxID=31963 RepID=A0AAI9EJG7_9MICO|nr:carboxylesterase family protein [Clavibacter nebraskensis]KXU21619.1 carboxylesterase [Clavibacter nebraskensis]OAH18356.1 carboxylesterase [Clavibacter nebraskensis]QGV65902.1 carboxylesterase/lipase family protein [Clavibacter nebraskensis]QGV68699.1 carboxylesterase/lipase family protein [Clavibacter nebraskensis]QGV71490.1 carboxylesterase/lipase family protein [Clavibacter nebraskensis]